MTPPTHWQRLRHKLYGSSVVWIGYSQIAIGYLLDAAPDVITIMGDPDITAFVSAHHGLTLWLKVVGFLTVVARLRKQIFLVLRKGA